MSLFNEYKETYQVFLPTDSDATKRSTYSTVAFEIDLVVIRLSAIDEMVEGEQLGEYRANAQGSQSANITQGALITSKVTGKSYRVVNAPRYNRLFNRCKLNLKQANF